MRRHSALLICAACDLLMVAAVVRPAHGQNSAPIPAPIVAPMPVVHVATVVTPALHLNLPRMTGLLNDDDRWDYNVKDEETIQKSFTLNTSTAHPVLEIDNVNGSIDVTGADGDQVQLVVHKTLRAESKSKLEEARTKVTLDITQEPDLLKLFVNGPFRCCNNCCNDCVSFHSDEGYSVKMDFELRVPRNLEVHLKTVNSGSVHVKDVKGNFQVRNVNGGIEMENVAGSGSAHTVNGRVRVTFRENPRENSDFGSINGSVELRFQHNLAADFRFKTFNGGVYSDFPVTLLPARAMQEERRDGKMVYRADKFTGGRIGPGGPEIKVDNLNGDIRILENHE